MWAYSSLDSRASLAPLPWSNPLSLYSQCPGCSVRTFHFGWLELNLSCASLGAIQPACFLPSPHGVSFYVCETWNSAKAPRRLFCKTSSFLSAAPSTLYSAPSVCCSLPHLPSSNLSLCPQLDKVARLCLGCTSCIVDWNLSPGRKQGQSQASL